MLNCGRWGRRHSQLDGRVFERGGGGVDQDIHVAAGSALRRECLSIEPLPNSRDGGAMPIGHMARCMVGDVRATKAYGITGTRLILHTVVSEFELSRLALLSFVTYVLQLMPQDSLQQEGFFSCILRPWDWLAWFPSGGGCRHCSWQCGKLGQRPFTWCFGTHHFLCT